MTSVPITFAIAGASVIGGVTTAKQIGPKLARAFLAVTDHPVAPPIADGITGEVRGFGPWASLTAGA